MASQRFRPRPMATLAAAATRAAMPLRPDVQTLSRLKRPEERRRLRGGAHHAGAFLILLAREQRLPRAQAPREPRAPRRVHAGRAFVAGRVRPTVRDTGRCVMTRTVRIK